MKYMLIDNRNREIATICADECIRDGKQLKFRVFDGEAH
jgi:hypothetical protein